MDELERRKQRLEEMHAKRREEQEMKRLKLERDAIIKKELQRFYTHFHFYDHCLKNNLLKSVIMI